MEIIREEGGREKISARKNERDADASPGNGASAYQAGATYVYSCTRTRDGCVCTRVESKLHVT